VIDMEIVCLREEALARGDVIDAYSLEAMIIPWGSDCCHGCEAYEGGQSITAHGYCPIECRKVSPHYFCDRYEQD